MARLAARWRRSNLVRLVALRKGTNQQPPQRGGAVPGPVWVGSKWLLTFPRVPVTPALPYGILEALVELLNLLLTDGSSLEYIRQIF